MHESVDLKYAKGANYQAVELPYDGNQLSMVILLPDSGQFNAFESSLDGQTVKGIVDSLADDPGESNHAQVSVPVELQSEKRPFITWNGSCFHPKCGLFRHGRQD